MSYALQVDVARHYGFEFASWGWTPEEVSHWLVETGYATNRITSALIRRAYNEQKAYQEPPAGG